LPSAETLFRVGIYPETAVMPSGTAFSRGKSAAATT
jgi:hypothetical protein